MFKHTIYLHTLLIVAALCATDTHATKKNNAETRRAKAAAAALAIAVGGANDNHTKPCLTVPHTDRKKKASQAAVRKANK